MKLFHCDPQPTPDGKALITFCEGPEKIKNRIHTNIGGIMSLLQHFEPNFEPTLTIPGHWKVHHNNKTAINFDGQLGSNITGFKMPDFLKNFRTPHLTQTVGKPTTLGKELTILSNRETNIDRDNYFFATTGTSVIDALTKFAEQTKRKLFYLEGSFHGRGIHEYYGKCLSTKKFLKHEFNYNDILLYEPIKGGYGKIQEHSLDVRNKIHQAEGDCMTIADEIQFGFYHTGHLWSHQVYDLNPDIVVFGKGLGQQVPVSGFISKQKVIPTWSSSFSNYPLGLAFASETLRVLEGRKHLETAMFREKLLKIILPENAVVIGNSFYFPNDMGLTQLDFFNRGVYLNAYHGGSGFKAHIPPMMPNPEFFEGLQAISTALEQA